MFVPNYKELFAAVSDLEPEYRQCWIDICNIESPTFFKEGVDRVGTYIIELAKCHGWKTESLKLDVSGDCVCITMNPEATEKPIVFSGHIDTVHPVGSFGSPAVHTDETKIYGPGVTDCKGGVAAALLAMAALEKTGYKKRPVILLLQTDEETSSKGSQKATVRYMCEKAKDCVCFLNCEGHTELEITTERKGILRYQMTVKGVSRHSSNCYDASSAVTEAAHKIIELEKMKDSNGLTCNCGLISGGTAYNTVPEYCTFSVDIRFADENQLKQAEETVKRVAERSYIGNTTCEAERVSIRNAMIKNERNTALFNRVNEIFAECGIPPHEAKRRNGGSDAADITAYGIPCLDSFGTSGGYIHTVKEYAHLSSLKNSAKILSAIALGI